MRIPGQGGEQVFWVKADEQLTLELDKDLGCISVSRKGITYHAPLSNVHFFELA